MHIIITFHNVMCTSLPQQKRYVLIKHKLLDDKWAHSIPCYGGCIKFLMGQNFLLSDVTLFLLPDA